jgi:hypothetical protein
VETTTQHSDLFALDLLRAYDIGNHQLLVRNTRTGRTSAVTSDVFRVLSGCEKFGTLAEHARDAAERLPPLRGQEAAILDVLQQSLGNGLFLNASQVCRRLSVWADIHPHPKDPGHGAGVVAVITCDRPAELERLLSSMSDGWRPGSAEKAYVIDDSREAASQSKNRSIVDHVAARGHIPVTYFGRAEQEVFIRRLVANSPGYEESIRFLVDHALWRDHFSGGLARNFALLLSLGKRLVVFDDDALFSLYEPDSPEGGATFCKGHRDVQCFAERTQWPGFVQNTGMDPVSGHLACLGKPLLGALHTLGIQELAPQSLAGTTVKELGEMHADSPVLVTQCGTLGHPGTEANTWLIDLHQATLDRLTSSGDSVTQALRNDNLWMGHQRANFSTRANMSLVTGLDNRHDLPPYFPILRGEDRLFGNMLSYIHPGSVVMDYPWAMPHLPATRRERPLDGSDFTARRTFPGFFHEWIRLQQEACLAESSADRLEHLSRSFANLGASSHRELVELYEDERLNDRTHTLKVLQERLSRDGDAPDEWVGFLKAGIRAVEQDLATDRSGTRLEGSPQGVFDEELTKFWRGCWGRFAQALRAWPEIRAAAEGLQQG